MDDRTREKLRRFIEDISLSSAVHDIIMESFLKPQKGDVYTLAASRMAIDLFKDAWKDLERLEASNTERSEVKQVGL